MFREFFRKYKIWTIVGALAVVVNLGVLIFVTLPKINAESIDRDRLEKLSQQQKELENTLTMRQSLANQINEKRESRDYFYNEVLGERQGKLTAVLEEREEIARKFGVLLERVRYTNDEVQAQPLERFSMSFPLQGSYASLRFFVNTLERSSNFFIIENVELEGDTSSESEMTMKITVSTYFLSDKPPLDDATEESMEDEENV